MIWINLAEIITPFKYAKLLPPLYSQEEKGLDDFGKFNKEKDFNEILSWFSIRYSKSKACFLSSNSSPEDLFENDIWVLSRLNTYAIIKLGSQDFRKKYVTPSALL